MQAAVLRPRGSPTLLFRNGFSAGKSCLPAGRQFSWSSNIVRSYQACHCKEVLKSQIILLLFFRSSLNFISFFFFQLHNGKYPFVYKNTNFCTIKFSTVLRKEDCPWKFAGAFTRAMDFYLLQLDIIFQPGQS